MQIAYKWTNGGYLACRGGVMAACGSLVAAGVLATGGTGDTIAGAVFAACNSGVGQYLCDKALPKDLQDDYTLLQGSCKAGSAAACDLAAGMICGELNIACDVLISEACEYAADTLVCEVKKLPKDMPEPPEQIDCSVMSHPLCAEPEPEPPTCDPNTQSCPPTTLDCGGGTFVPWVYLSGTSFMSPYVPVCAVVNL
jgi:hypothetical protein